MQQVWILEYGSEIEVTVRRTYCLYISDVTSLEDQEWDGIIA
jgi:hypothetical protein